MIYTSNFLFLFLVLVQLIPQLNAGSCSVSNSDKKDCGFAGIDQNGCLQKNCCWVPQSEGSSTPWCFYSDDSSDGGDGGSTSYSSYDLSAYMETANGFKAKLTKTPGTESSTYGADITNLILIVVYESAQIIRVKVTAADSTRWEVPQSVIPRIDATSSPVVRDYSFRYTESPFTFQVVRVSDGDVIFSSSANLLFKDQYLEITTAVSPDAKIFGLGESARLNHALARDRTYTGWAVDQPCARDVNLYGSYPFYLQLLDGKASGAVLINSNGMDTYLGQSTLTYKTIGGILDLYIFIGPTPASVVSQLTQVIGRPAMVPYWSLGFHNCRWGYTSLLEVKEVVANYAAAKIPLDTQWMDIDYMQNYRDFTTDSVKFSTSQMGAFVDSLHASGMHFVPITDPGIMVYDKGYDAYDQGVKADIFIKDMKGGYYMSQVWPGPTYMPDFFHPAAQGYWTDQVQNFHDKVAFDGMWIDMNEASNFCNTDGKGQVCANSDPDACDGGCCLICETVDPTNNLDFPPYQINSVKGPIGTLTLAMSATNYGNLTQYNTHNLFGIVEQIATAKALKEVRGKRSFVLSRSGYLGTGVYSARWLGDNMATWEDLQASIIGIMDFNMFGVPMIGADICGFSGDSNEELCARWIEVGAFYPFARDHNSINNIPQELYVWSSVAEASRTVLGLRYQLLPYMYTSFSDAHFNGATVARALWMNFPSDPLCASIDRQFMLGDGILLSPVLDSGATSVSAYFPQGYWYSLFTKQLSVDASTGGKTVSLATPLTETNAHVLGGSIIPMQEPALTTTAGRATPFSLLVALSPAGTASGSLFWDDGEQIDITNYLTASYTASYARDSSGVYAGSVAVTVTHNSFPTASSFSLNSIQVLGVGLSAPHSPEVKTVGGGTTAVTDVVVGADGGSIVFNNLKLGLDETFVLHF